jgi:2-succinyl-6-hydroxy-2,4-cyclohexadiene-1-carboxylate synthase
MPDWRPLAGPLAARTRGSGRRIVFVHGFTQTSRSWERVANHFAAAPGDHRYEVALIDLPGHGDSGTVRADLRRTADLIASTTGEAVYVGYSLGGRVCLHLALMYPHIVDRLVLLGATPGIVDDGERARRRQADDLLAQRILEIGVDAFLDEWSAMPLFKGLVLGEDERTDRRRNTTTGLADSLRLSGTGTQLSLWERLVELNMPVLAMAGALDTRFVPIAERIAASVPDGALGLIHDAGHAAHLQRPMQVITRMEPFLRR